MSIERGFATFLRETPAVRDLIGTRVYTQGKAPDNAGRRYAVTTLTGAAPSLTLTAVTLHRSTITVQAVAETPDVKTDLVAAIRSAIGDSYRGTMDAYQVERAYWEDQQDATDPPAGDDGTYTTTLYAVVWWKPAA